MKHETLPATPVAGRDHIQGPANAAITLLEYGDYECPYCGEAYSIVKEIQERLGDRLCFVFRNFPLRNMHPHAEHAAEAAEAAGAQGKFWEMHDALFENQETLEDEDISELALELGLDAKRLMDDVRKSANAARIQEDFRSGTRSGVNGTPSFFINGVRFDGDWEGDELFAALSEKIA